MQTDRYISPLSTRYASAEMQYLFSQDFKFRTWRRLWIALAKAEKRQGLDITDEQIARLGLTAAEEAAQSAAEEEFEADNVDGDVQPMTPDETIAALRNPEVREILAAANQTMADQLKEETEKLLDSVLYTRSMEMKNGFHMSDF